jgi:hypothetical protein
MKRNLTRETRRPYDSLTAMYHLKKEMETKQEEILVVRNKLQGAKA